MMMFCSVEDGYVRWRHSKIFGAAGEVSLSSAIPIEYVDFSLSPLPSRAEFFVRWEVLFADASDTEDRISCSARQNSARFSNSRVNGNASEDLLVSSRNHEATEIHPVRSLQRHSRWNCSVVRPSFCRCYSCFVFATAYQDVVGFRLWLLSMLL